MICPSCGDKVESTSLYNEYEDIELYDIEEHPFKPPEMKERYGLVAKNLYPCGCTIRILQ